MLRSLRNRLILSHVLPLLVTMPIMGIALVYVLETQFLLPGISTELAGDAKLIAQITHDDLAAWINPAYAQFLLQQVNTNLNARVMFLTYDGRLLASTDSSDLGYVNSYLVIPGMNDVEKGVLVKRVNYSPTLRAEVIDVMVPVISSDRRLVGIVRMTYRYSGVYQEITQLRDVITFILVIGLILGVVLGFVLALNIGRPIQNITKAVYELAYGNPGVAIVEQGPEEIRLLQRAYNFLAERLQNLEQSRRMLLANLVHELGRPLGALRSAIQALSRGASKDPQLMAELLEGMDDEAARLQHLLDDLAHLYDQVLGTLELNRETVAFSEWVNRLLLPWQEAALEKRIHWETEIPPDLPAILVDPVRLGQAIGNLVSNAVKFTPVGGTISIKSGVKDGDLWVKISDSGPGIAQDEQEKVFTPFYRGKQGRRFPQGMGLGLSIARDLILAHGGKLEMDSTPGMGSTFTILIPKNTQSLD